MESNPNQRIITTKKAVHNKDNIYTAINLEALKNAMHTLKPTTFEMWVYLGKNQNNHTFALSKVDCLSWCNFKDTTYQSAFNELVKKGYLVQSKDGSNHYDFYEIPKEKEEEQILITPHKADNGFNF
ncbi:MAG: hypothetical protein NC200_04460 [Candidatus Gastranaerophilales bacterium]|nr:hypothetical protein [Candidatus Gastranaerophilales bacterium]